MTFEQEKYYSYIQKIENSIIWSYVIVMFFAIIIGCASPSGSALIITIPIGLLLCGSWTLASKIKVQEMRMKMDIYNMIKSKGI